MTFEEFANAVLSVGGPATCPCPKCVARRAAPAESAASTADTKADAPPNNRIILGATVRDKITGFRGIVVSTVQNLTRPDEILVRPPVDKDGKMVDPAWFDARQVERVGGEKILIG